jgi:hypothetical protein
MGTVAVVERRFGRDMIENSDQAGARHVVLLPTTAVMSWIMDDDDEHTIGTVRLVGLIIRGR